MKPVIVYLHLYGIQNSIFIDHGRILATTAEEVEWSRLFTYKVLKQAGWTLENKKSDKEGQPSQVKDYLGFFIHTVGMTLILVEDWKPAILNNLEATLDKKSSSILVKDFAKILGKIVTTEPGFGTMPLMATRAAYIQFGSV
jgi:hypothetical protein